MVEQGIQGTLVWHEIYAGDPEAARKFYTDLIGWGTNTMDMGGGQSYTMFTRGGEDIGGYMPAQNGQPAHWLTYIGVDGVDETCARAGPLGGKIVAPPMDIPVGRMAILQDPAGALFALFTPKAG